MFRLLTPSLQKDDYLARPITYPTIPKRQERIRVWTHGFSRCTKDGLPIVAVLFYVLFSLLSLMSVSSSLTEVFNCLVNVTVVGVFFSWSSINLMYLRFYSGPKLKALIILDSSTS